jgi:hypothetical protein
LLDLQGQVLGITTMGMGEGQNINFVVPAKYVTSMLSVERLTPLGNVESANSEKDHHGDSLDQFVGTYAGMWQSQYGSGIAVLNVTADGEGLTARVAITGSPTGYKGDSLAVTVKDFGGGVLTVDMKAKNSPLSASGIFRNGAFVGDYRFRYRLTVDKGSWALKK